MTKTTYVPGPHGRPVLGHPAPEAPVSNLRPASEVLAAMEAREALDRIGPRHDGDLVALVLEGAVRAFRGRKAARRDLHAAGLITHDDGMADITPAGIERLQLIAAGTGYDSRRAHAALTHLADEDTWVEVEEDLR